MSNNSSIAILPSSYILCMDDILLDRFLWILKLTKCIMCGESIKTI